VQAEIEGVLERRADRAARKINVTVSDGVVRLSGRVHSMADREAVVGAARFTRGVRIVEDGLRVSHPEETRAMEAEEEGAT
jgi:osmotically-inducible protein OsmY